MSKKNNITDFAADSTKITIKQWGTVLLQQFELQEWIQSKGRSLSNLTVPHARSVPGLGKSKVTRNAAMAFNANLQDFRCGDLLPSDLRLPVADHDRKVASFYVIDELPLMRPGVENSRWMLFFDELMDANVAVQRPLKRIFNEREFGNFKLQPDTLICAASNGLDMKCSSEAITASLANRLRNYDVVPDIEEFITLTVDHGDCPELAAFLESNNSALYNFGGEVLNMSKWDGQDNFASCRTLFELGDHINSRWAEEAPNGERTLDGYRKDPIAAATINGLIGRTSAGMFDGWMKIYDAVGSIENLLRDPDNAYLPDDPAKKWVVCCKLVSMANAENLDAIMRVAERMNPNVGTNGHLSRFVATSIARQRPALAAEPSLVKWVNANIPTLLGR